MERRSNKFLITILIVTMLVLAATCGALSPAGFKFAAGEDYFANLASITALNSEGERVAYQYAQGVYGRNFILSYNTNAPKAVYKLYIRTGAIYAAEAFYESSYIDAAEGTIRAELNLNRDGDIMVETYGINIHGVKITDSVISYILSDSTPPPIPVIDDEELNEYHISKFNLSYRILPDAESGVDFTRSYYEIDYGGGNVVRNSLNASYEDRIMEINDNADITVAVYDKAGNLSKLNRVYNKHGVPESDVPVITVLPETGFGRFVTVSITWGEEYDANPFARKFYSVVAGGGSVAKTRYAGAFEISTEDAEVIAYYFENGTEKSVSVVIENVDRTPPSSALLRESFSVTIDIREELPLTLSVRATDAKSGIKRVYIDGGAEFTMTGAGLYTLKTDALGTFSVVAEDNAGNTATYGYSNPLFDVNTMKEYSAIYRNLNLEDYTSDGVSDLNQTFYELGAYLLTDLPQNSEIEARKRACNNAVTGNIVINSVFADIPDKMGTASFSIPASSTSLKKGARAKIIIDTVKRTNEAISQKAALAASLAGYDNFDFYCFTIKLVDADGTEISVNGPIALYLTIPSGSDTASAYRLAADDAMPVAVASYVEDNRLIVDDSTIGEYYVLYETEAPEKGFTLNGRFYSYKLIGITAGIIGGVAVIGIIATIVIANRDKKRAK